MLRAFYIYTEHLMFVGEFTKMDSAPCPAIVLQWTSSFPHRRCMKTCWWSCPLPVSSCLNFWEPVQMWTSTTWPRWTQRCTATFSSSRATRVTWKSWASTSLWSTTIWERLRWGQGWIELIHWFTRPFFFHPSILVSSSHSAIFPSSCLVPLCGVNNSFPSWCTTFQLLER